MKDKIMELIQIAMQFEGKNKVASVEFASHINGITVCVSENGKVIYMRACYLEKEDVDGKLELMKFELLEYLKQKEVA